MLLSLLVVAAPFTISPTGCIVRPTRMLQFEVFLVLMSIETGALFHEWFNIIIWVYFIKVSLVLIFTRARKSACLTSFVCSFWNQIVRYRHSPLMKLIFMDGESAALWQEMRRFAHDAFSNRSDILPACSRWAFCLYLSHKPITITVISIFDCEHNRHR